MCLINYTSEPGPIFQMARIAPGDFIYYLRQNNRNINERIFFSISLQDPGVG